MSAGVAIIFAALGLLLIVIAVRGTYTDVTLIILHPPQSQAGGHAPEAGGSSGGRGGVK